MPRSKSSETSTLRKDSITIEADQFIQAFEKPTQIYRYIKSRLSSSPLFLQRTLNFMTGRSKRNNARRVGFKVDDMLEAVKKKNSRNDACEKISNSENLTIGFSRFIDEDLSAKYVKVQTRLEKISHKRRKEWVTIDQNQIPIGESTVIVNGSENSSETIPAVFVTSSQLNSLGDSLHTTFYLSFDVEPLSGQSPRKEKNGEEPPNKVQCVRKKYHAQLPFFEGGNLLASGFYTVNALNPSRMTNISWESIPSDSDQSIANWAEEVNKYYFGNEDQNPFNIFETKTPKIELYMQWTQSKNTNSRHIQRPKMFTDQQNNNNNKENKSTVNIPPVNGVNGHHNDLDRRVDLVAKSYVFQFVVSKSLKQRTQERNDFICPWCSLDCLQLYSLLKHLKLSHARCLYQYTEENQKGHIDIFINEMYDGSYSGAPHDVLLGPQRGPKRRNVMTDLIVYKPRRPTFNLNEFLELNDGEMDHQRSFISGHNRIYYHSETCIPILPKELDYDSEGEPNPKWLQRTTKQMIDEFTDVNEGEKELMKLWNLHVMKHGFVGDCQLSLACDLFLAENGEELLRKSLYRNYLVHLNSLFEYGLISPRNLAENIQKVTRMMHVPCCLSEKFKNERKAQINHWLSTRRCHVQVESDATPSKIIPAMSKAGKRSETKTTAKSETEAAPKKRKISIIPS